MSDMLFKTNNYIFPIVSVVCLYITEKYLRITLKATMVMLLYDMLHSEKRPLKPLCEYLRRNLAQI